MWNLDDDFGATARALEAGARAVSQKTAQKVVKDAQGKAPVKTGHLRDSARVVATANGAEVIFEADYAPQIENGHMDADGRFVGGQHFLANSLAANQETLEQNGESLLGELGAKT